MAWTITHPSTVSGVINKECEGEGDENSFDTKRRKQPNCKTQNSVWLGQLWGQASEAVSELRVPAKKGIIFPIKGKERDTWLNSLFPAL